MNYQDELIAKLEASRPSLSVEKSNTVTTNSLEEKLLGELSLEFEFSQYDLDENDILRTLKINDILKVYGEVFIHPEALKVFYTIARVDIITAKNLHAFLELDIVLFKRILKLMAKSKLIFQNENNELELSLDGKSLAARLGIFIL